MKHLKILGGFLVLAFAFLSLCACGHMHTMQSEIMHSPTCTQTGILKQTCVSCGEISYEELSVTKHTFVFGVCVNCGALLNEKAVLERVEMPEGASGDGMLSLTEIYVIADGLAFDGSYSYFISCLSETKIKEAKIDALRSLHFTVEYNLSTGSRWEVSFFWPVGEVSLLQAESIGILACAEILEGELFLHYSNGRTYSAGMLAGDGATVTGFGFNSQNELIIFYSDDKIAFGGRVASS